jgi:hypothetical protein
MTTYFKPYYIIHCIITQCINTTIKVLFALVKMEGQDIKGLMEAYSHIYSEPESLNEEVETEEVNIEVEEDSEVLDENRQNRARAARAARERARAEEDRAYRAGGGDAKMRQGPQGSRRRFGGVVRRADVIAQGRKNLEAKAAADKAATPTPPPTPAARPTPAPAARPSAAPAARPAATPAAKTPAAPAKDNMAGASKEDRMAAWAKANPKLAAAKAERDRTRGTSSSTNPQMQDMKSRMPAAAPKKTGGEAAAASTSGPKFNANAPKLNVASRPSGASTAGGAKAAASKTAPKFNPSAPKIDLKSKTAPAKAAGTKFNPNAPKILNQDVDIFDIIKGHLLDEGFAETEEAAMVIMANMSEEWRQDIIEFFGPKTVTPKDSPTGTKSVQVGKKYPARLNGQMVNVQYDKSGNKSTKPMTSMERGIQALKMRNTGHSSMNPRP